MGQLDFFNRNNKSEKETVSIKKPTEEQILFADTVLEILSPTLEKFDFKRSRTELEEHFTTIIFRKDRQYVKISGSTYPTDYPYTYNIILGEGDSEDFLEWDWNSVALWRLKSKIEPSSKAQQYSFPFGDKEKFEYSIKNANKELVEFAESFLLGDLTTFKETRKEQNKDREPYKIYTPDKDGNYSVSSDKTSEQQKKKYS